MNEALIIAENSRWDSRTFQWLKSSCKNLNITLSTVELVTKGGVDLLRKYVVIFYTGTLSKIDTSFCVLFLTTNAMKIAISIDFAQNIMERRPDLFDHVYTNNFHNVVALQGRLGTLYSHYIPDPEFVRASDSITAPNNKDEVAVYKDVSIGEYKRVENFTDAAYYIVSGYDSVVRAIAERRPFVSYKTSVEVKSYLTHIGYPTEFILMEKASEETSGKETSSEDLEKALSLLKERSEKIIAFLDLYCKISKHKLKETRINEMIRNGKRPREELEPSPDLIINKIAKAGKFESNDHLASYICHLTGGQDFYKIVRNKLQEDATKIPEIVIELCMKRRRFSINTNFVNPDNNVRHAFSYFQKNSGILFDSNINKTFTDRNNLYSQLGYVPYDVPWMGILYSLDENMFDNSDIILSLTTCTVMIVFSNALADALAKKLTLMGQNHIHVISLLHPTSSYPDEGRFSLEEWQKEKKILQVSTANFELLSIYRVKVTDLKKRLFAISEKFLPTSDLKVDAEMAKSESLWDRAMFGRLKEGALAKGLDITLDSNYFSEEMQASITSLISSVEVISDEQKLKENLTSSILLMELKLDSRIDIIFLDAIARCIPVVINRCDLSEQYLGKDYPLLFTDLKEVANLLTDDNIKLASEKIQKRSLLLTMDACIVAFEKLITS